MRDYAKRLEAALRARNQHFARGDVIDSYYEFNSPEDVDAVPPWELRESDIRALLAENARLRMQNDELSTENREMRYGPTMSAEGWEA